jgi:hypothetical protein
MAEFIPQMTGEDAAETLFKHVMSSLRIMQKDDLQRISS